MLEHFDTLLNSRVSALLNFDTLLNSRVSALLKKIFIPMNLSRPQRRGEVRPKRD